MEKQVGCIEVLLPTANHTAVQCLLSLGLTMATDNSSRVSSDVEAILNAMMLDPPSDRQCPQAAQLLCSPVLECAAQQGRRQARPQRRPNLMLCCSLLCSAGGEPGSSHRSAPSKAAGMLAVEENKVRDRMFHCTPAARTARRRRRPSRRRRASRPACNGARLAFCSLSPVSALTKACWTVLAASPLCRVTPLT